MATILGTIRSLPAHGGEGMVMSAVGAFLRLKNAKKHPTGE